MATSTSVSSSTMSQTAAPRTDIPLPDTDVDSVLSGAKPLAADYEAQMEAAKDGPIGQTDIGQYSGIDGDDELLDLDGSEADQRASRTASTQQAAQQQNSQQQTDNGQQDLTLNDQRREVAFALGMGEDEIARYAKVYGEDGLAKHLDQAAQQLQQDQAFFNAPSPYQGMGGFPGASPPASGFMQPQGFGFASAPFQPAAPQGASGQQPGVQAYTPQETAQLFERYDAEAATQMIQDRHALVEAQRRAEQATQQWQQQQQSVRSAEQQRLIAEHEQFFREAAASGYVDSYGMTGKAANAAQQQARHNITQQAITLMEVAAYQRRPMSFSEALRRSHYYANQNAMAQDATRHVQGQVQKRHAQTGFSPRTRGGGAKPQLTGDQKGIQAAANWFQKQGLPVPT